MTNEEKRRFLQQHKAETIARPYKYMVLMPDGPMFYSDEYLDETPAEIVEQKLAALRGSWDGKSADNEEEQHD